MLCSLILDHLIGVKSPASANLRCIKHEHLPFLSINKHAQYTLYVYFRPVAGRWTITSLGIELGNCQYAGSSIVEVCKSKVTLSEFLELICTSGAGLCQMKCNICMESDEKYISLFISLTYKSVVRM